MELLKLLSSSEVVAQAVSFLLLLFILRTFLWKRVLKALDDRRERIASEFKAIDESKKAVERLKIDYEDKIGAIEEKARQRIKEAQAEGVKIAGEIKKMAQSDAEKIIELAKADMKDEVKKAKEELKKEVVGLTMRAAESVIEAKMTAEDDKRLVEDFLKKIDDVK